MSEASDDEEEDFNEKVEEAELFSRALNPSMQGALESLIGTKCVAASINNDPLYQIRLILEAFRLLSPEQKEKIEPSQEEREQLMRDYEVLVSLLYIERYSRLNDLTPYGTIPWAFSRDAAPAHLKFYSRVRDDMMAERPEDEREEFQRMLSEGDPRALEYVAKWWYMYFLNHAYFSECITFKNAFIDYAMVKCLRILREIQLNIVSRETWESALAALSSGGKQSAKPNPAPTG